jgi:hypothetical protein
MREVAATAPSIVSDKADYAPGETVTLTGSDWQAAESVHIFVNDSDGQTWSYATDVTSDDNGGFTTQFSLPSTFIANYSVTATGASSGTATTTFTDANVNTTLTLAFASASITYGDSDGYNGVLTGKVTGNDVPGANQTVTLNRFGTSNCSGSGASVATHTTNSSGAYGNSSFVPTKASPLSYQAHFNGATISGDNWRAEDSACQTLTVAKANTTTTASSSASSITTAGSTTINWSVSSTRGVAGNTATGTMSVVKDSGPGTLACTLMSDPNANISAGQTASGFSYATMGPGMHNGQRFLCGSATAGSYTFHVHFADSDGNYNNSDSSTLTLTVTSDTSPPVITKTITGTAGSAGWYRSDVTVQWTVTDPDSPVVIDSGCGTDTFTAETTGVVSSCQAHSAGGSANDSVTIKIDKTKPVISASATSNGSPYSAGDWTNHDVSVQFACADAGSVQSGIGAGGDTVGGDATLGGETSNGSVSSTGECVDEAGNHAVHPVTFSPIRIDKTKPVISTSATSNGSPYSAGDWTNHDVTVSFSCADSGSVQSAIKTDTVAGATLSTETSNGSVTNTGVCTDNAGNSANATTFSPIKIDKTKPVISASAKNEDNTTYVAGTWTNQSVTVSFSCADDAGTVNSGLASNTVAGGGTQSAETATGSFTNTGGCTDNAGNSANANTFSPIKIDKTEPVITASAKKADNSTYIADTWTNQTVTVTFSCADNAGSANSGIATSTLTGGMISSDTASGSVTNGGACTDNAGNDANSKTFSPIKVDKTAPDLGITDTNLASYNVCGTRPSKPGFSPSDGLSGLDGSQGETWSTPGTPSGVGTYTYSAHAQDNAGNPATYGPKSYVVSYGTAFGGFLQPINSDGSSRFKLGSTIPVKFQALCNGTTVGNVVAKMYVKQGDNQPDPGTDEAISTASSTTGNLFRYDTAAQQYIFNLSTKLGYVNPNPEPAVNNFGQGTWTLKIGLDDGTFRSINIQLVR